ncbi:McrB family protein [Methanospirillum hungatei]|uniref:McrB family protein n=1 Tax=Methanospirillum hungatei TaxID=2203 RepID=UPI0026EFABEF|nr:AAA family ATPase [Methanospirillum hungatei]MCA1916330.1 AAA family ATPase [Methanospirillum hungatei]
MEIKYQTAFTEIGRISNLIVESNLDDKQLSRSSDAEENQNKYNSIVKPAISEFREKYNNLSPNQLIKKILDEFLQAKNLTQYFDSQGHPYYGQKVNPYVWGTITKKDPTIKNQKFSYYPQLYITILPFEVRFGLTYGDYVDESDQSVEKIRSQPHLAEKIIQILSDNHKIKFISTEKGNTKRSYIDSHKINNSADIIKYWTNASALIQIVPVNEIPPDIKYEIDSTFNALLEIFLELSGEKMSNQQITLERLKPYIDYFVNNRDEIERKNKIRGFNTLREQHDFMKKEIPYSFSDENLLKLDIETFNRIVSGFFTIYKFNIPNEDFERNRAGECLYSEIGFEELKKRIYNFLYGDGSIYDRFISTISSTKNVGAVFLSELLCYRFPNDYPIYNTPSKKALFSLNLISSSKYEGSGQEYFSYVQVMKFLLTTVRQDKNFHDADFCTLETFLMGINRYLSLNHAYIEENSSNNGLIDTPLTKLLKRKGQIILYGPPGTGKTYQFKDIKNNLDNSPFTLKTYDYEDIEFYWVQISKKSQFNFSTIDLNKIYTYRWNHAYNWDMYFIAMKPGDILACYGYDEHRIIGFAKCIDKGEDTFQYQFITITSGPSYSILRDDTEFRSSIIIRTKANAIIRRIEPLDFERIVALAGKDLSQLNITTKTTETTIKRTEFITFHQSFSYEEFIEGLRPHIKDEDKISYEVHEGVFKRFCRNAFNALVSSANLSYQWNKDSDIPELIPEEKRKLCNLAEQYPFYLFIDEINRGDISKIFGELITLLEKDKRLCSDNELTTRLPYSQTMFGIPPNLYIIGTMNTADRSIALIDIALRRRFGFIEIMPDYKLLRNTFSTQKNPDVKDVLEMSVNLLEIINSRIIKEHDRDHQIGHSFFLKLQNCKDRNSAIEELAIIWYHEIIPLLQEYFYDSPKSLFNVIGSDFIEYNNKSYTLKEKLSSEEFFTACLKICKNLDLDEI